MVGGVDNDDIFLDATEVYSGGQWRTVGALPAAGEGLRGVTIANSVYITGGDTEAGQGCSVPIFSLLIGGGVGTKPLLLSTATAFCGLFLSLSLFLLPLILGLLVGAMATPPVLPPATPP